MHAARPGRLVAITGHLTADWGSGSTAAVPVVVYLQGRGGTQKVAESMTNDTGHVECRAEVPPLGYGEKRSVFIDVRDVNGDVLARSPITQLPDHLNSVLCECAIAAQDLARVPRLVLRRNAASLPGSDSLAPTPGSRSTAGPRPALPVLPSAQRVQAEWRTTLPIAVKTFAEYESWLHSLRGRDLAEQYSRPLPQGCS